jgi:hypothetical protein
MLVTAIHESGQDVQITFDKEALKLLPEVANHPTLFNESNWEMVGIIYKHETSSKRIVSGFKDIFTGTDSVKLKLNMSNGELYQLHKILISGEGRTPRVMIKRSDIPNASSMDLTLGGAVTALYSIWNSYAYSPYTSDPNILSVHTLNAEGGIYGGSSSLPDWVRASNITFGANESGSVIFKLGSQAMENMAFGLDVNGGGFFNVGIIYLGGALRPQLYGDIPNVTQSLSSPENICKIEKVGSTEFKLYVNGTLLYTINNLSPSSSWSINCRPAGSNASNGIISSYKE